MVLGGPTIVFTLSQGVIIYWLIELTIQHLFRYFFIDLDMKSLELLEIIECYWWKTRGHKYITRQIWFEIELYLLHKHDIQDIRALK